MKNLRRSLLTVCALLPTVAAFAQQSGGDPLSGTWTGDWGRVRATAIR